MATSVLIPVAEYLETSYHPDCEYIDGEVRERNVGEIPHSGLQVYVSALFVIHARSWKLRAFTEQRVQVSADHFRIPDICVLLPENTRDPIVRIPPVACIEILSPKDSLSSVQGSIDDYLDMGVENIWIVDPAGRRAWTADRRGLHRVEGELSLPAFGVSISLSILWQELDDLAAGR